MVCINGTSCCNSNPCKNFLMFNHSTQAEAEAQAEAAAAVAAAAHSLLFTCPLKANAAPQPPMLGYEWVNHPSPAPPPQHLILTDDHLHHHDPNSPSAPSSSHLHRPIFPDPFSSSCTFPHSTPSPPNNNSSFLPLYDTDPRSFPGAYQSGAPFLESSLPGPAGFLPKSEPEYPNRIGLNLGGRTYFAADDDLVSRLYRRSKGVEPVIKSPKCQAEGCNADLSHAKHYHRRHKVCEFHSKAATVVAAGLTQRFCQQCSRFHLLSEFDDGKRSCRKRLADHNRRRRKSNQSANRDNHQAYSLPSDQNAQNSSLQSIQRSPSDSGANSLSSVTVAVSSPLASFDSSFRQRSYE